MTATIHIQLTGKGLDSDDLQQAEMHLVTGISQIDGCVINKHEAGQTELGARGEPVTVGAIILSLVSGGALTALIGTLQSWLTRDDRRTLKLTIESAEGQKITLDSAQFTEDQIKSFLRSSTKVLKDLEK